MLALGRRSDPEVWAARPGRGSSSSFVARSAFAAWVAGVPRGVLDGDGFADLRGWVWRVALAGRLAFALVVIASVGFPGLGRGSTRAGGHPSTWPSIRPCRASSCSRRSRRSPTTRDSPPSAWPGRTASSTRAGRGCRDCHGLPARVSGSGSRDGLGGQSCVHDRRPVAVPARTARRSGDLGAGRLSVGPEAAGRACRLPVRPGRDRLRRSTDRSRSSRSSRPRPEASGRAATRRGRAPSGRRRARSRATPRHGNHSASWASRRPPDCPRRGRCSAPSRARSPRGSCQGPPRAAGSLRLIARTTAIAFGPSRARATSGPEVMKSTRPPKNGFGAMGRRSAVRRGSRSTCTSLRPGELEATLLVSGKDAADKLALDAVGLDEDECPFGAWHVYLGYGRGWTSRDCIG